MKEALRCARILHALAAPQRLRIIDRLRRGPRTVTELARLIRAEIPNTSNHLGILRRAGLVRAEKRGRFLVCSLPPTVFRPAARPSAKDYLDLGCCRLEIPTGRGPSRR